MVGGGERSERFGFRLGETLNVPGGTDSIHAVPPLLRLARVPG